MIAIVLGPDDTMVRDAVRELLQQRDPGEQNTSRIDGRSAKAGEIHTAAASAGFFGVGRVVIVEDFLARFGRGTGKSSSAPDWAALFGDIPADNTLIMVDRSLASVPAAVKKVLPKDAVVRLGDPPRGRDLLQWMSRVAKEQEAELGEREARVLADRLYPQSWSQKANNPAYDRPPDLGMIRQVIAKLALSAHPGKITTDLINEEVARGDEDKIFKFLDAAISGNLEVAIPELDRLLVAGEDPGRLLAQLSQNIELSAVIATSGSRNPADVGKDIGMNNPNRMTMIARGVQGTGGSRMTRALSAVTSADRRIKRGELKDQIDGLYDVLVTIASSRRGR